MTRRRSTAVEVSFQPPGSRAARQCLQAYFDELAARFETGFDPAKSNSADDAELTPPTDYFAVACAGWRARRVRRAQAAGWEDRRGEAHVDGALGARSRRRTPDPRGARGESGRGRRPRRSGWKPMRRCTRPRRCTGRAGTGRSRSSMTGLTPITGSKSGSNEWWQPRGASRSFVPTGLVATAVPAQ